MQDFLEPQESEYWKSLTKKEKEEITNSFLDSKLAHLLPKYKSMSTEEIIKSSEANRQEINKQKIIMSIYEIIIFLKDNNRYNVRPFTSFDINNIKDYVLINEESEFPLDYSIEINLLNFDIDGILLNIFNSSGFVNFILNKESKYLNYSKIERIKNDLINYTPPKIKPIFTYIMTDASGLFKIGKAICVENRLSNFKTGNPSIKIIAVLESNIEHYLHKKYSKHRYIGEWFELSEQLLSKIIKEYKFIKHKQNEQISI